MLHRTYKTAKLLPQHLKIEMTPHKIQKHVIAKLPRQPLLTAPATQAIVSALTANGAQIRFVGGCVRDAVVNKKIKDIDFATTDSPDIVVELLKKANLKVLKTGIKHGTVIAVIDKTNFEITTLRIDRLTDGRHATVEFTDSWGLDAARRDFTINALSATPNGDIFDYFNGLEDLQNGIVRFVGSANIRVQEDYLRILRFFRFYSTYGHTKIDTKSFEACQKFAHKLASLSNERVRDELFQILSSKNPILALKMMRSAGVLAVIFPEAKQLKNLEVIVQIEKIMLANRGVVPDPLRRFFSLILGFELINVKRIAKKFVLSNNELRRLTAMHDAVMQLSTEEPQNCIKLSDEENPIVTADKIIISWSSDLIGNVKPSDTMKKKWFAIFDAAIRENQLSFPVNGEDALRLGVPEGPKIGTVLKTVKSWWKMGGCEADRDACLHYLKKLL